MAIFAALLIPAVLAILVIALLVLAFHFGYMLLPTSPRNNARLNLQGKTVLLTGASSGIGKEMARILHRKGAKLILTARSTDKLEQLCEELAHSAKNGTSHSTGPMLSKPRHLRLDLEEIAQNKQKLHEFLAQLRPLLPDNRLDVLVNNAGQMAYGSVARTDLMVLRRMLDINYLSHVALTQALLDRIPDAGAVVVLGSIVGRVALPYLGAYSAAKHALQAFFDSLRAEDRPQLQILTVSAGYVNTELGPQALNEAGGQIGQRDPGQVSGMSAEFAARAIVDALEARETELLLAPFLPRFLLSLRLFTPNLLWFFLHRNLGAFYGNWGRPANANGKVE